MICRKGHCDQPGTTDLPHRCTHFAAHLPAHPHHRPRGSHLPTNSVSTEADGAYTHSATPSCMHWPGPWITIPVRELAVIIMC